MKKLAIAFVAATALLAGSAMAQVATGAIDQTAKNTADVAATTGIANVDFKGGYGNTNSNTSGGAANSVATTEINPTTALKFTATGITQDGTNSALSTAKYTISKDVTFTNAVDSTASNAAFGVSNGVSSTLNRQK